MHLQHKATSISHKTDIRLATVVAAFASLGAAVIHIAVTPQHWQEWIPSGLFFVGIAGFQLAWAGVVLRVPRAAVLGVGIVANLGSMALWGVSRSWGTPIGPNAGMPEAIGIPGVLATLFEAMVVLSAAWSLLPRERTAVFAPGAYRFALGGAAVFVMALTPLGVISGLEHAHGDTGHSDTGSHQEHGGEPAPGSGDESQVPTPERDSSDTTPPSDKPKSGPDTDSSGHSHS